MANKKILLVEDDPNFGTVLKDYLALNDYDVHHAKDGLDGLIAFKNDDFDICILDVMMPKKDGFSLAKDIRAVNADIPLFFLTHVAGNLPDAGGLEDGGFNDPMVDCKVCKGRFRE